MVKKFFYLMAPAFVILTQMFVNWNKSNYSFSYSKANSNGNGNSNRRLP